MTRFCSAVSRMHPSQASPASVHKPYVLTPSIRYQAVDSPLAASPAASPSPASWLVPNQSRSFSPRCPGSSPSPEQDVQSKPAGAQPPAAQAKSFPQSFPCANPSPDWEGRLHRAGAASPAALIEDPAKGLSKRQRVRLTPAEEEGMGDSSFTASSGVIGLQRTQQNGLHQNKLMHSEKVQSIDRSGSWGQSGDEACWLMTDTAAGTTLTPTDDSLPSCQSLRGSPARTSEPGSQHAGLHEAKDAGSAMKSKSQASPLSDKQGAQSQHRLGPAAHAGQSSTRTSHAEPRQQSDGLTDVRASLPLLRGARGSAKPLTPVSEWAPLRGRFNSAIPRPIPSAPSSTTSVLKGAISSSTAVLQDQTSQSSMTDAPESLSRIATNPGHHNRSEQAGGGAHATSKFDARTGALPTPRLSREWALRAHPSRHSYHDAETENVALPGNVMPTSGTRNVHMVTIRDAWGEMKKTGGLISKGGLMGKGLLGGRDPRSPCPMQAVGPGGPMLLGAQKAKGASRRKSSMHSRMGPKVQPESARPPWIGPGEEESADSAGMSLCLYPKYPPTPPSPPPPPPPLFVCCKAIPSWS